MTLKDAAAVVQKLRELKPYIKGDHRRLTIEHLPKASTTGLFVVVMIDGQRYTLSIPKEAQPCTAS